MVTSSLVFIKTNVHDRFVNASVCVFLYTRLYMDECWHFFLPFHKWFSVSVCVDLNFVRQKGVYSMFEYTFTFSLLYTSSLHFYIILLSRNKCFFSLFFFCNNPNIEDFIDNTVIKCRKFSIRLRMVKNLPLRYYDGQETLFIYVFIDLFTYL